MTSLVYRIDNLLDGKFYIGVCSGGLRKRKREHLCCARTTWRGRSRLYSAIRKYGEHNFEFSVIADGMSQVEALAMEVRLICEMSPAYNITIGGEGAVGAKITEEGRKRLSEAAKSRPGYWRGKKRPDMAAGAQDRLLKRPLRYWAGKKRDAATNVKISQAKTGVPRRGGTQLMLATAAENMRRAARARRKPVRCLDDGLEFQSSTEASVYYGFHRTTVTRAIRNDLKVYGKTFELVERLS